MKTIRVQFFLAALFLVMFSACEKNYYTTNIDGDIDTVFIGTQDTTAPRPVKSITTYAVGLGHPTGMAFNASGSLLVAEWVNPGTIRRISTTGVVNTFATGGSGGIPAISWLAVDSSGNVYVSCEDGTVKRVGAGGGTLTTFLPDQSNPTGLTFDRTGNLYVSNIDEKSIRVYSPSGVLIRTITEGVGGPVGLAFDGWGNLFVANRFDSVVTRIDTAGIATNIAWIPGVNALIADRYGNLIAAEADDFRGHIYFISSKGVVYLLATTNTNPGGLAFDHAGNLYVSSHSGGIIQKFTF